MTHAGTGLGVGVARRLIIVVMPSLTEPQRALVVANVGLVHCAIKRLHIRGPGREEALAEGLFALCAAALTYHGGRGKFSTWAMAKVRWHLCSWLTRESAYRLGCSIRAARSAEARAAQEAQAPTQPAPSTQRQTMPSKAGLTPGGLASVQLGQSLTF